MDHQSRLLSCFKSSFKFVIAKTTRQKEKNKKEYKGDEGKVAMKTWKMPGKD